MGEESHSQRLVSFSSLDASVSRTRGAEEVQVALAPLDSTWTRPRRASRAVGFSTWRGASRAEATSGTATRDVEWMDDAAR